MIRSLRQSKSKTRLKTIYVDVQKICYAKIFCGHLPVGLLVKQITPALHRLQECFLIFEDQNDGEWDRGWYQFVEIFPQVDLNRYTQNEALKLVLPRLFYRFVYLNTENAAGFYGLQRLKEPPYPFQAGNEAEPGGTAPKEKSEVMQYLLIDGEMPVICIR